VGERYNCLAFTLEMPFKDVNDRPDHKQVCPAAHSGNSTRSLDMAVPGLPFPHVSNERFACKSRHQLLA